MAGTDDARPSAGRRRFFSALFGCFGMAPAVELMDSAAGSGTGSHDAAPLTANNAAPPAEDCGAAPASGGTALSDLTDDLIAEILLRVSPGLLPWSRHRVDLVCKSWRRIASDPGFRRRYVDLHPVKTVYVLQLDPDEERRLRECQGNVEVDASRRFFRRIYNRRR